MLPALHIRIILAAARSGPIGRQKAADWGENDNNVSR